MKFSINLSGKTLYSTMRQAGYSPALLKVETRKPGEQVFQRFLRGSRYPKFHVYAVPSTDNKSAELNLHLDQKQPSYKGSHAHNAEHDGQIVESEVSRIRSIFGA